MPAKYLLLTLLKVRDQARNKSSLPLLFRFVCGSDKRHRDNLREQVINTFRAIDSLIAARLVYLEACSQLERPRYQRSDCRTNWNNSGMPDKDMQHLEVGAMKLQHRYAGEACKRTCYGSGGDRIHGKAAPQKQPAQKRYWDGMSEPGNKTGDAR